MATILIVDNDLVYAKGLAAYLASYFSERHVADTQVNAKSLIDDLVEAGKTPDVAIVNISLRDESDIDDESGLQVAMWLRTAQVPCILMALKPTEALRKKARGRLPGETPLTLAVVKKGSDPQTIFAAVMDALVNHPRLHALTT